MDRQAVPLLACVDAGVRLQDDDVPEAPPLQSQRDRRAAEEEDDEEDGPRINAPPLQCSSRQSRARGWIGL